MWWISLPFVNYSQTGHQRLVFLGAHKMHKLMQQKESGSPVYVHCRGHKFSAISFLLQRVFEQLKRQTIQGIAHCNCAFHSAKHWSSSSASTKSSGMNHVLRLILQYTGLHHPTMQNKESLTHLLSPWLPLLLCRCLPGLKDFFFTDTI